MKRFFKKIIVFIPFAIVFYCVGICIFGEIFPSLLRPNLKFTRDMGGFTLTRLNEVKNVSDIDILFVGSSHAYRSFDPRIFKEAGYNTFNLGTSAQTPLQTKFLLERYLDEVTPKEIIFQVSPFIFAIDGVESTVDILSNDFVDEKSINLMLDVKDINVLNTLIYSSYEDLLRDKTQYHEPLAMGSSSYISGGYVENTIDTYTNKQDIITDFDFKENQIKALHEMITMVEDRGIVYHLIYVPVTESLYTSIVRQHDFENMMKIYDSSYFDFNKILQLDTTYFYDRHHLNKRGVSVFNNELIDKLKLLN